MIYYAPTSSGPWTPIGEIADNTLIISSAALPPPGGTMYYTGDARLEGTVSGLGVPLKYSKPPQQPGTTPGCDVKQS
jgi:hypothetical protein